jgi:hypothetical protein
LPSLNGNEKVVALAGPRQCFGESAVLPSAFELIERIPEIKPDIILIETESPSRDTLEHIGVMNQTMPRPVVMFSQAGDSDTIRLTVKAGVATYVVDGSEIDRLKPVVDVAIARFEEHQALKQELSQERGLWLPINIGTDRVLHMAMARIVIENNWQDQDFIDKWVAKPWEVDSGQPGARYSNRRITYLPRAGRPSRVTATLATRSHGVRNRIKDS